MFVNIDSAELYYESKGSSNSPLILLLHGWGSSSLVFEQIAKKLSSNFHTISVDLPGFGKSPEPIEPVDLDYYCNIIREFVDFLQAEKSQTAKAKLMESLNSLWIHNKVLQNRY